ncbi:MAG: hypothetical protein GY928_04100 [Colwellia sp.]|nr:hypothetical protein [Colwellia sp.]
MKYHSILTPVLTSLCLLTVTASVASDSRTLLKKPTDRWFEIEVILFKHIAKKANNDEQFNTQDLSTKKRNALDLLAPYLQPDIASLKQLLPTCGEPVSSYPYNVEVSPFSLEAGNDDSNDENNSDEDSNGEDINDASTSEQSSELSTELNTEQSTQLSSEATTEITSKLTTEQNAELSTELNTEPAINIENEQSTNTAYMSAVTSPSVDVDVDVDKEEPSTLTQTENSDESTAQSQYTEIVLPSYNQYPSDDQSPFCIIPKAFFQHVLTPEQLTQFSIDGFPIEKLVTTVNATEQWRDDDNGDITWASDKPYLISKGSLRLKPIANSIRRSRNYAPLLHLGWRQVGDSPKQARAMKLYAGENLSLNYQQAIAAQASHKTAVELNAILAKRSQAQTPTLDQELTSNALVNETANTSTALTNASDTISEENTSLAELSIEEELRQQVKQQQLDKLFEQFDVLSKDISQVSSQQAVGSEHSNTKSSETFINKETLERVVAQLSADINKPATALINDIETLEHEKEITKPQQSWSIDGLFKVHLDHFLYLNSEFNIIDSSVNDTRTQSNVSDDKLQREPQVISFKQNRRLITGEIHYFDHPHIGMVVQIRRFDPTKPTDEAVTQVKK